MKRVDFLITQVRRLSDNTDAPTADSTVGITDEEIIQFLNDAQDRIETLIGGSNSTAKPFITEKFITLAVDQEEVDIGDRIAYSKQPEQVEYSRTGLTGDYQLLSRLHFFNRDTSCSDWPYGYYMRFGKIYLVPPNDMAAATLRVLYPRQLDDLDKRRGKVTTVTGQTSTGFTSITIDSTADEGATGSDPNLSTIDYICIVDGNGEVQVYNIPVLSYSTSTNILTPDTFTFASGEQITAGDYVVFNKYSTTHSLLPDECERYLLAYGWEQVAMRDSSDDLSRLREQRELLEREIVDRLKNQTGEIAYIPQLDWGDFFY